jgi:hypothetical protein
VRYRKKPIWDKKSGRESTLEPRGFIGMSAFDPEVAMSAIGPKRTFPAALHMSAFGGKADIELMEFFQK